MVVNTAQGLELKGRRRLGDAGVFESVLEDLMSRIQQQEGGARISDLDLSQNSLSFDQFEALFTQLGAHNTRVQRFRLFGCPTLNDDVVRVLADYLRLLTPESAPSEMHLSDCAITTEGWNLLMSVIEETELFPVTGPSGRPAPLYLRLENNYISEDAIKEKMDAGIVRAFTKTNSWQRPQTDGTVKVNLVVRPDGKPSQKQGEPPAPEEAAPPKQVWDKGAQPQQTWGGTVRNTATGWGGKGAASPWNAGGKGMSMPGKMTTQKWTGQQALPAGGAAIRPPAGGAAIRPPMLRSRVAPVAQLQSGGKGASFSNGANAGKNSTYGAGAWRGGTAGGAADRSRTPAGRGGVPMPPAAKPPPKAASDLPHPWEEHWSDEYQIPYFWNSETGDSLWEKPTA